MHGSLAQGGFPAQVQMGNLRFSLGYVQYDGESPAAFPLAAQAGLGAGVSLLAVGVVIIVFIYRWVPPDEAGLGATDEARGQHASCKGAESKH